MQLFSSSVGRKILMAITGVLMVLFVVVHLIGNSTIYFGLLNAYAHHLHALPPLVWAFRLVMLVLIVVHIFYGITLTLENNAANPQGYAVKRQLKANFSSENMIWTGLLLLVFIVYHMCHFTARLTPDIVANTLSITLLSLPECRDQLEGATSRLGFPLPTPTIDWLRLVGSSFLG